MSIYTSPIPNFAKFNHDGFMALAIETGEYHSAIWVFLVDRMNPENNKLCVDGNLNRDLAEIFGIGIRKVQKIMKSLVDKDRIGHVDQSTIQVHPKYGNKKSRVKNNLGYTSKCIYNPSKEVLAVMTRAKIIPKPTIKIREKERMEALEKQVELLTRSIDTLLSKMNKDEKEKAKTVLRSVK